MKINHNERNPHSVEGCTVSLELRTSCAYIFAKIPYIIPMPAPT